MRSGIEREKGMEAVDNDDDNYRVLTN